MGFGERISASGRCAAFRWKKSPAPRKIGARSLRALEQEDFDKLPGGIFNKGFVRSYARYLGIDEEQAVADYLVACGEPLEKAEVNTERLKELGGTWKPSTPSVSDSMARVPWLSLAILMLLIAAIVLGVYYRHPVVETYRQWRARRHLHAAVETSPPAGSAEAMRNPFVPARFQFGYWVILRNALRISHPAFLPVPWKLRELRASSSAATPGTAAPTPGSASQPVVPETKETKPSSESASTGEAVNLWS